MDSATHQPDGRRPAGGPSSGAAARRGAPGPLTAAQLRAILSQAGQAGRCALAVTTPDGHVLLGRAEPAEPPVPGAGPGVERRAPVLVRGAPVAEVRAWSHTSAPERVESAARLAAGWLASAWTAADELENLAAEIVRAYEELHLLYELCGTLTGQLGPRVAAETILDKLLEVVPAAWAELALNDDPEPLSRRGPGQKPLAVRPPLEGQQVLQTVLRSAGQVVGRLALGRPAGGQPFSSIENKLLDAVGTLAAYVIHNVQLYEELRQQAESLRRRESHLRAVLDNVVDGIFTVDESGLITSANQAAEHLFGRLSHHLRGQPLARLLEGPTDQPDAPGDWWRPPPGRPHGRALHAARGRRRDGTTFPADVAVTELRVGARREFIVSVRDLTERKRAEALEHQALHDPLTALPNRAHLIARLNQAIRLARQESRPLALLMLDLDGFKDVNDGFGHHVGDLLLQQAAGRLRRALRSSDLIARLGGDEFAVLLPGADALDASRVADKLRRALAEPFFVEGRRATIGASVGVALCPLHGSDAETLLRRADSAMYVAKRSRRGSALYRDEPDQRQPSWLTLHDDLRRAIEQGELTLFYQPRVEVRTGRLTHVEALVRWQHPQRGLLPPDRFIPLVEHSGLVGPFSAWVLNAALEQARRWREQGLDLAVSVNLSAQDLHDPQLPETLAHLLRRWAVPPGRVELEIVESGLVASRASAGDTLARLHALGVRIAVDDLGTGYSSFAYLTQLPLDELKIARSFVLQMALNQREAAVVRAMIGLAHDLGLTATAEGVEDETTWRLLSGLGCDRAQGYFIGRPMPPDALAHWIEGAEWAPAGPARTERSPE